MSKQPRKKLRKRRTRPSVEDNRSPTQRLYDYLIAHGFKIDEQFNHDKYQILLKRIKNRMLNPNYLQKFKDVDDEKYRYGRIEDVFKVNDKLPSIFAVSHLCLPDNYLEDVRLLAVAQDRNVVVVGLDSSNNTIFYNSSDEIVCNITAEQRLPADLRQWPSSWRKVFIRIKSVQKINSGISNHKMVREKFGKQSDLVQLRRSNPFPSKKQRKQISKMGIKKESYDANDLEVAMEEEALLSNTNY